MKAGIDKRLKALDNLLNDGRLRSTVETACIHRQIIDLKTGHKRGLVWDEEEAQRVISFFNLMNLWEGSKWAGKKFVLTPTQEHAIVAPLFGWWTNTTREKGGKRRFTKAGMELPRKFGKSTLLAGIANQGLIGDGEEGAQVYSAATTRQQAGLVFDMSRKLLGPELRRIIDVRKHYIEVSETNSIYKPLAADHEALWGLNIHRCVVDELHAHPNRFLWDTLLTSIPARENPMVLWISTAGFDRQSIWYEERLHLEKVLLKPEVDDDGYFAFFARAEDDDDWTDPVVWEKANPHFDFLQPEYYKSQVEKCKTSPAELNTFKRMHLNMVTDSEVNWMPMEFWDLCGEGDPMDVERMKKFEAELAGMDCYAGVDLASTRDLTSWALVFPWGNKFKVLVRNFAPERSSSDRAAQDKQSYAGWASRGFIDLTKGNGTDYRRVQEVMERDKQKFNIRKVAFDPYNMPAFHTQLVHSGWPEEIFTSFNQSASNYNDPMNRLLELVLQKKFDHGNDPVLRWAMQNVVAKQDDRGYIKPDKRKSQDKIDPAVATIMAIALAFQKEGYVPVGKFYENNELELL
jgi:phage terminase large subunit-like protein